MVVFFFCKHYIRCVLYKLRIQLVKNILIPTDLTLHSLNLIKHALQLLKGEACHIVLLHPVPLPDRNSITELLMLPRDEGLLEKPGAAFKKALDRITKAYAIEINSIEISRVYCDSASQINDFVVSNKIDLVLSTVSRTKATDTMSHFNSLVKDVDCPVLYIPEFFEINLFRKIAFVLDTEGKTNSLPDSNLIGLLCRNNYHLTFLLVFRSGANTDKLKHRLDSLYASDDLKKISYSVHLIHERDVTSGVVSFINEFEVDLVVTSKKRSMLSYMWLNKSNGFSDTAINTKVPCLSIK